MLLPVVLVLATLSAAASAAPLTALPGIGNRPSPAIVKVQATVSRAEMRRVQSFLTERGFDPGAIDGIFGRQTLRAITAFILSEAEATDDQATLVTELKAVLADTRDELFQLHGAVAERDGLVSELRGALAGARDELFTLHETVTARDALVDELRGALAAAREELFALHEGAATARDRLTAATDRVTELESLAAELRGIVASQRDEVFALHETVGTQAAELEARAAAR